MRPDGQPSTVAPKATCGPFADSSRKCSRMEGKISASHAAASSLRSTAITALPEELPGSIAKQAMTLKSDPFVGCNKLPHGRHLVIAQAGVNDYRAHSVRQVVLLAAEQQFAQIFLRHAF